MRSTLWTAAGLSSAIASTALTNTIRIPAPSRFYELRLQGLPAATFTTQAQLDVELRKMDAETQDSPGVSKLLPSMPTKLMEYLRPGIIEGLSGEISFGDELLRGRDVGVYVIGNADEYVIKYYRVCLFDPISSLVAEAFFLEDLDNLLLFDPPIAPKFVYLSGPADDDIKRSAKMLIREAMRSECIDDSKTNERTLLIPRVRFMISERVGTDLNKYMRRQPGAKVPVEKALSLGIQIIRLLQKLHTKKSYIHGDIHLGNVAFAPDSEERLVLIDFGNARVVSSSDFTYGENTSCTGEKAPQQPRVWCNALLSQWEAKRIKTSFRDDVYRALFGVAMLIHGYRLRDAINGICGYIFGLEIQGNDASRRAWEDYYVQIKETDNVFHTSYETINARRSRDPITMLFLLEERLMGARLASHVEHIKTIFANILNYVRATPIQNRPNYDWLAKQFEAILNLP